MKRRILCLVLPILMSIVLVISGAVPAYADYLYFWGNMCHSTDSQCMNEANGIKGNFIQFWAHSTEGEPNNDWNEWEPEPTTIGIVNCASGYPFSDVPAATCLSWGVNTDDILKLAWAPRGTGSGYCVYSGGYDGGDDYLEYTSQCSPTNSTYNAFLFVLSRYGWLISVYGTYYQFLQGGNQKRVYLGTCDFADNSDANGESICLTYNNGIGWVNGKPPS